MLISSSLIKGSNPTHVSETQLFKMLNCSIARSIEFVSQADWQLLHWMYRLWVWLLMTETVAIAAAARSPEYWLPVGARLCKPKGGLAFKEGEAMIRKDWVGRLWFQILVREYWALTWPELDDSDGSLLVGVPDPVQSLTTGVQDQGPAEKRY